MSKSDKAPKQFSDLNLSPLLLEVLKELTFTEMTPVQAQSIPALLQGRDLIGQSATGSGKTAAFTLPILQKIKVKERHIQALVMCPTRELCTQVAREMRRLGRKHPGLQVLILAGGQFIAPQLSALEKGAHIAVGTPGRLLDIISRGKLNLTKAKTIVLDEADRMLDMGFEEDMEQILDTLPEKRQTVFFSATFPDTITEMSDRYQTDPVKVTISDDAMLTHSSITEHFYATDHNDRMESLETVLRVHPSHSTIVFCNLKAVAHEVAEHLRDAGFAADSIHGDLEQYERDRVMAKFRNLTTRILVATDVAARGLDVPNLDLVINYDTPAKPDVYVHRIGRTGRAGRKGVAVSLLSPKERHKLDYINDYTDKQKTSLKPRKLEKLPTAPVTGEFDDEPGLEAPKVTTPVKQAAPDVAMATLCIFGGRKDKLRPGDILGALTGDAGGLAGSDIGKIEILDRLAYVALRKDLAKTALTRLQTGRIKGRTFKVSLVD